jgi:hypothetical protein
VPFAFSAAGVLKQADPALVDPGLTAQLECLLDDVVVGKRVCGRLAEFVLAQLSGAHYARRRATS